MNVFKLIHAFKMMYVLTSGNYLLGALNGCTFFKIMPAVKILKVLVDISNYTHDKKKFTLCFV